MRRTAPLLAALLALAIAGCASSGSSAPADHRPRAVCLDEPRRGDRVDATRPLFFLFCVQTP